MSTPNLEGVAKLTRQLQALGSLEDGKAMRRAVRAGIRPALVRARELIPVGKYLYRSSSRVDKFLHKQLAAGGRIYPGFARDALRTISTINSAKNIASGILGVRKAAYYAVKYLEMGTRKMAAQPWIRRAFSEARSDCEAALRQSLIESVEKAARTE